MLKYSNMGIGSGFLKNRNWIRNHSFSSSTTLIFLSVLPEGCRLRELRSSWAATELGWSTSMERLRSCSAVPGFTWWFDNNMVKFARVYILHFIPLPPPPSSLEEVNMVNGVNGEEWGYVHKISYMHTKQTYNKCVVFTLFHIPVSVKCICSIEKNVIF